MKFIKVAEKTVSVAVGRGKNPKTKNETASYYVSEDGSAKIAYYANPNRAWTYLLASDGTNEAGAKLAGKLINAATKKAIEALGGPRGDKTAEEVYSEATKEVSI